MTINNTDSKQQLPTVTQLAQSLANKATSSEELTIAALQNIEQRNPELNAFISVDKDGATKQANERDKQPTDPNSPLHGIPVAIKDIFMQQGTVTSCASHLLDNYVAPYTATAVERLQKAGAVIVGKTNLDEFAMGSTNKHSFFGACKHPFDSNLSPGGSSGGSAVAVASGLVPVALGTDTGGSVRQPAALCGIVGMKPTYGRISRYGMVAYASSLDQCGVFSRTAQDCGTVLQAIAGHDLRDATSSAEPVDNYQTEAIDCSNITIGIAPEFLSSDLDDDLKKSFDATSERFRKAGAKIIEVSIPHFQQGIASYYVTATAEASSNLGRFDGVRYGNRATDVDKLRDMYTKSRSEGFGDEVQRRIMLGVFVLSSGYFDAYYIKAQQIRRLLCQDFNKAFTQVDAILSPVTPSPHLSAKLGDDNPTKEYLADLYTVPVNMAGLPGISFPCHYVNQPQLAYGHSCQLIGPHWSEKKLLNLVHTYEQILSSEN